MFYIMLERKTHLAKPSQVPPWAWHSTALWTIDWGWILGNIQIWLVSAPSTAYLSEIIESYGNAKRPTRDHQRDWNTDCTILHIPWRMSRFHLALSISRPSSALVHRIHGQRGPANVGPRVQELGTRNIQDSLKRWKKTFQPSKIEWFPSGSQHFQHSMNGKLTTYCPVHCWVHRSGVPGSKHHLDVIVFHAIQPVPIG